MKSLVLAAALLFHLAAAAPASGQDGPADLLREVRFDQRLDAQVPLDLPFRDEGGRDVRLGDYFKGKPVVLVLAYYRCPRLCNQVLNGLLLPQFYATIDAIPWQVDSIDSAVLLLNSLVLFIGALSVLVYFFFSLEHRGFIGGVSRVGIYTLMIAFGASFGYTIMARVSLLIGRIQFLMFDWIGEEIVARIASLFHGG